MLRLFKKRYVYPEVKCPRNARELTEKEMLLVNGGGEKKEEPKNDTHTVVSGDTLSEIVYNYNKENGTNLTVDEVARNSGIEDPDTIFPGQTINLGSSVGTSGTGIGSGSSGSGSGSGSTGGSDSSGSGSGSGSSGGTPSSPSSSNNSNDATANKVKGPNHRSAHDQKYINEMMEKDRKNALGGNGIHGTSASGKKLVESQFAKTSTGFEVDHENKVIRMPVGYSKAFKEASDQFMAYDMNGLGYTFELCWDNGDKVSYTKYADLMNTTTNEFATWISKEDGAPLSRGESTCQKIVGIGEMLLGFGGIFFTGGKAVQTGAWVMADGAIVFSGGMDNEKVTPFLHLGNDFANPAAKMPNANIYYVSPLP